MRVILIFGFLFSHISFCFESRFDRIKIYPQSQSNALRGYNNCDMLTNGELNIMQLINKTDIVFDVGANKGEWSQHVYDRKAGVEIYAFEPLPEIFKTLQKRDILNFKAYNVAFETKIGKRIIFYYDKNEQTSQLSTFFHRPILQDQFHLNYKPIEVNTDYLDNFCMQNSIGQIDFLKIDSEGCEFEILDGAGKLLTDGSIKIIQFEYGGCYKDSNTTLKDVASMLAQNRYVLFRIFENGLIYISHWDSALENFQYSNYLAVLAEEIPGYDPII